MQASRVAIIGFLAACQAGFGVGRTTAPSTDPAPTSDALITMPAVTKLGRAEAEARIRQAGLRGEIRVALNDGAESTEVCRQVPSEGGKTSAHFNVDLELCRPEAPPAKPLELAGLTIAAATAKAQAWGFDGKVETRVPLAYIAGCKDDTVCRFEINQDNKLLLYLNKKLAPISTPD